MLNIIHISFLRGKTYYILWLLILGSCMHVVLGSNNECTPVAKYTTHIVLLLKF